MRNYARPPKVRLSPDRRRKKKKSLIGEKQNFTGARLLLSDRKCNPKTNHWLNDFRQMQTFNKTIVLAIFNPAVQTRTSLPVPLCLRASRCSSVSSNTGNRWVEVTANAQSQPVQSSGGVQLEVWRMLRQEKPLHNRSAEISSERREEAERVWEFVVKILLGKKNSNPKHYSLGLIVTRLLVKPAGVLFWKTHVFALLRTA